MKTLSAPQAFSKVKLMLPVAMAAGLIALPAMARAAAQPAACMECKAAPMSVPDFAATVATVDMLEIKLGQIAQTNSTSKAVKGFGAYMIKSHTQINAALTKLAASEGVKIPTSLDPKHAAVAQKLSGLKGADFDKAYIPAMVAGHTKVLAMFKSFAGSCTDPGFKKFAEKFAPVIAKHLAAAEKVQAELQKQGVLPKS